MRIGDRVIGWRHLRTGTVVQREISPDGDELVYIRWDGSGYHTWKEPRELEPVMGLTEGAKSLIAQGRSKGDSVFTVSQHADTR